MLDFLEFLAITGAIIWLSILLFVIMTILVEREVFAWATFLFIVSGVYWIWNFGESIWVYVQEYPLHIVGIFVAYVVLGVIWSFLKWNSYIKKIFRYVKKAKEDTEKKFKVGVLLIEKNEENNEHWEFFKKLLSNKDVSTYNVHSLKSALQEAKPKTADMKSTIISWIGYWPISLIGTLLNDPIRRLFNWVYSLVSSLYDKMSAKTFEEI